MSKKLPASTRISLSEFEVITAAEFSELINIFIHVSFPKQQIVQSLCRRDFTSLTESAMVLHAQIQAAAVCCKSQSIPLFGRHAVFRLDVVGDLCILPRTRAQREVALLTAPDIELMADQIRRDA